MRPARRWLVFALAAFFAAGCGTAPPPPRPDAPVTTPRTPAATPDRY